MLPRGSTPIRPITGRPSLAPSSCTRRPQGFPCELLSRRAVPLGRRRAYHVPPVSQGGLGRASAPVVRRLRRRSSEPPDLTTYLLVQAYPGAAPRRTRQSRSPGDSIFGLFVVTTFNSASRMLTLSPNPGSRPPWMLGVAALVSRPWPPSMREEVTLSRELRTPGLSRTHVSVGYCRQHCR